ncbi:MAG: hypothetical protein EP344_08870 [Bacteroidetes bacterium]|nr:MAG: hypothetical protein EP344_08870 [Bacteroidota bacterium]
MKFSLRHQSTGKLYRYLVPSGHLMLRGFFKKIYTGNRNVVPEDKPVLIAANHPTAFVDPCLLCVMIDVPIYNMARGDIFRKPFFRKLLESINMFPVFRVRDGYTGRDRNDAVFKFCSDQLVHHRVVTIYVEGEHRLVKQVRPVQKGIVRIAFGSYEQHQMDELQIIPAGCTYMYGDRPRDEVMVQFGSPIFVRDYWEEYQTDPNAATNRLIGDIESGLREVCLHLDDLEDAPLLEDVLTLHRSSHPEPPLPLITYSSVPFQREKALCNWLNTLPADAKGRLADQTTAYFNALRQAGISDAALCNPQWGSWQWLLLFLIGLPAFLVGWLTSWPVIAVARYVADKKVRKLEFYTSVRMGAGHLSGMLYYFLVFLISLITWNPWWIALSLGLPFLGWFSMFYREQWQKWAGARTALRHPARVQLKQARQAIEILDTTAAV